MIIINIPYNNDELNNKKCIKIIVKEGLIPIMPKTISLEEKNNWLDDYENGMSEAKIAKKYEKHLRTIRGGIEEARRVRDVRIANVEILKDALKGHQNDLIQELEGIRQKIEMPRYDYHPLNWHECIQSESPLNLVDTLIVEKKYASRIQKRGRKSYVTIDLLQQHLHYDETKLFQKLAQWETKYQDYIRYRADLQVKIIAVLRENIGYPVNSERDDTDPPFVYGHTSGNVLYSEAISSKLDGSETTLVVDDIIADPTRGEVNYRGLILASVPGDEDAVKKNLIKSINEIKSLEELRRVIDSTNKLADTVRIVRSKIDTILLAKYIPGRCDACRRLGL